MKIWTSHHTFEHSWETVVQAAWRKYPNPHNESVTAIDIMDRRMSDKGVLRTNRLFRGDWSIPAWATSLIGLDNPTYAYEYTEVDPRRKSMFLRTVNLNCLNYMNVEETLTYKPHPEDNSRTLLEQSTQITVHGVPLVSYMENLMASVFTSNTQKGRQAMEWVIGNIKREVDELSQKFSEEYQGLSSKLSSEAQMAQAQLEGFSRQIANEYEGLSQNVRRESEKLLSGKQTQSQSS